MSVTGQDVARVLTGWPRCDFPDCSQLQSELGHAVLEEAGDWERYMNRGTPDRPGKDAWVWWCDEHAGDQALSRAFALTIRRVWRKPPVIGSRELERIVGAKGAASLRLLARHRDCHADSCIMSNVCQSTTPLDHAVLKIVRQFIREDRL